jgi:hypothetical protein
MAEEIILNKRTDQLPLSEGPEEGFWIPMWNTTKQRTERVDAGNFIQSQITGNFEWITDNDPGYAEDEVVTWGGKWWQSQQDDNLNVAPGTDNTYWLEINKASSFSFWAADSVYAEDKVFVFYTIEAVTYLFELINETRPFVSGASFTDELNNGDWAVIGRPQSLIVDTALVSDIVTVDFKGIRNINFVESAQIDEDKTIEFTNYDNDLSSYFRFSMDAPHALTFPAAIKMVGPPNASWVSPVWTPIDGGVYEMFITYINNEFFVRIDGPYI